MGIARSTFYSQKKQSEKAIRDFELADKIELIQDDGHYTYGRRRMGEKLEEEFGIRIGECQIGRLMRANGLNARIRRIRTAKPCAGKAYQGQLPDNILARQFYADQPLQKMVTDVTYIPYYEGGRWRWGYLSLVQDLFDRSIVAWVFSKKQDTSLSMRTLQILSFRDLKPGAMLHSDRGSIYTAAPFREALSAMGLTQSYSRSGNCHDNATMESFNGTFKVEALYNPLWAGDQPSFMDQNKLIAEYIEFYNNERPCSVLGNLTPNQYKTNFLNQQQSLYLQ